MRLVKRVIFYSGSLAGVRSRRIVASLRALLVRWMALHENGNDHCHKGPFSCREGQFFLTWPHMSTPCKPPENPGMAGGPGAEFPHEAFVLSTPTNGQARHSAYCQPQATLYNRI